MTVKDIMAITDLGKDTVLRKIKEKYPQRIIHGKPVLLNREESIEVVNDLKVKVSKNIAVESQNATVESQNATDRIDRLELMFTKLIEMNMVLIQNQTQKQLEYKQDYYSVIGYANYKGIKDMTVSEARRLSLEAKKLSQELGKEIRSIPDERWGKANSYHVEILDKIFEM